MPTPGKRVECPHAKTCPGCPAIGLDYDAQLEHKRGRALAALARYPELSGISASSVLGAEPIEAYRTRAKLVVGPRGQIGLYGEGARHRVVDLPGCRVLAPALADVVAALRRLVAEPPPELRRVLAPHEDGGALRALDLREVQDGSDATGRGVLVTLVLDRDRAPKAALQRAAAEAVRAGCPGVAGVAVGLRDPRSALVLGREPRVLLGPRAAPDRVAADLPFVLASHGAFAQVHRAQAAALLQRVKDALEPVSGRSFLELFAGSGALALALAAAGARVTLADSFGSAVRSAREAAEHQGITGVDARAGDAHAVLDALSAEEARFDAIIVNPPRRGLDPLLRARIARLSPEPAVYVSCEPETLARDLAHLSRLGLGCQRLDLLDMIPLTHEVEAIAVLRRAPTPPPRLLYEDAELLVVDKDPHEPTTPQAEHQSSLLARVRALPGAERAVPIHRLDLGASGLCLFAREPAGVAGFARALAAEGTRKEYRVCVRGIAREKGVVTRPLVEQGRLRGARTRYWRESVAGGHSLLRVQPAGGRTHQIRRHLAAIGHPVLGDARHGHAPSNRHAFERLGLDRPFLHLARLELAHPTSGVRLRVESPLAGDLQTVLTRLGASG